STGGSGGAQGSRSGGAPSDDGGVSDAGGGCDERQEPSVETCLLDERYSVFVSVDAFSDGDGTRLHPASSIQAGIELARKTGVHRVIVCIGNYDENVMLSDADSHLAIYGGFTCPTKDSTSLEWGHQLGRRSAISPATGGALTMNGTDDV